MLLPYTTQTYKSAIPHSLPFMLQIAVSNLCNLRCQYCSQSNPDYRRGENFIEYSFAEKIVSSLKQSVVQTGTKIGVINLIGMGEPLLHPDIVRLVRLFSSSRICNTVALTTNGTLLTDSLSRGLLSAGLNVLRFSLNGLSATDYKKYTGVEIDYEMLKQRMAYFHDQSLFCLLYTKIMSYMVETDERKALFYNDWKPRSDIAAIENVAEIIENSALANYRKGVENFSQFGDPLAAIPFCPMPFTACTISEKGAVAACCVAQTISGLCPSELLVGEMPETALHEIWNGNRMNALRLSLIDKKENQICKKCKYWQQSCRQEESLETETQRLHILLRKSVKA